MRLPLPILLIALGLTACSEAENGTSPGDSKDFSQESTAFKHDDAAARAAMEDAAGDGAAKGSSGLD